MGITWWNRKLINLTAYFLNYNPLNSATLLSLHERAVEQVGFENT